MGKLRYIILGVFCAGLLLIGIGVGVTLTEFSNLTYVGEKVPAQAERREDSFRVKLVDGLPIYVMDNNWYFMNMKQAAKVAVSETAIPGQVEIQIVYDTIGTTIDIWSNDGMDQSNQMGLNVSSWDDFGIFMTMKDEIMEDLKAGKIASYQPLRFESITITVHPDDAPRVHLFGSTISPQAVA